MNKERYHRQLILDGFGEEAQISLAKAKVLVIGAGGIGCPALSYLVAAGVGEIGIVDHDRINLSNLHRQILYSTKDIGQLKVNIAEQKLHELNPAINITAHPFRLQQSNAFETLNAYDLILDGTDNFETRYLINDACTILNKPLIFAAVLGYEGQLAIFNCEDELSQRCNYRDIFPFPPRAGEVQNCAENGVLGVLPGIIGTMAATEIIKLITGIGKPLMNELLHYNALNCEQYKIKLSDGNGYKQPKTAQEFLNWNYEESSMNEGYQEINWAEMLILQQEKGALSIDVREFHEVPLLDQDVFKQIPMSVFKSFLNTDIIEENIILICQRGIRSQAAAEALHEKYGDNKNIYSLKGGIVKWNNHL